jgi:hypothetical protein
MDAIKLKEKEYLQVMMKNITQEVIEGDLIWLSLHVHENEFH